MTIITAKQGGIIHPFGLAHQTTPDGYYLYWTEFTKGQIKRAGPLTKSSFNGTDAIIDNVVVMREDSIPLFELRAFHYQSQIGKLGYHIFALSMLDYFAVHL